VALIATVILEEVLLDVQSSIGLRTMEVATRLPLGMMMQAVVIMEDMVAVVVLVVVQSISVRNILMMVRNSQ